MSSHDAVDGSAAVVVREPIPSAAIFAQHFLLVFSPQLLIPVDDFDGSVRQAFFDIDHPAVDADETARIPQPAPDFATEGTVQG